MTAADAKRNEIFACIKSVRESAETLSAVARTIYLADTQSWDEREDRIGRVAREVGENISQKIAELQLALKREVKDGRYQN